MCGRRPLSSIEQGTGTGDTSNGVQIKIVFPANPGAHTGCAANSIELILRTDADCDVKLSGRRYADKSKSIISESEDQN